MNNIIISNEAYEEFKKFLDENNVTEYSIRVNYLGNSCGGPILNVTADSEVSESDLVEKMNDVTFLINKEIINTLGTLTLLSSDENEGRGLSLRPVLQAEGGCSSCGGGCH